MTLRAVLYVYCSSWTQIWEGQMYEKSYSVSYEKGPPYYRLRLLINYLTEDSDVKHNENAWHMLAVH